MGGRNKLPLNVHKLKNTAKAHPERMRKRENEPENKNPIGKPSRFLTRFEKAAWREIVKWTIDGVLGEADRLAVEQAARLLVKCRGLGTTVVEGLEVPLWATIQEQTLFFRYLGQFGMMPADRSKINIPKGKPKNPFDD